MVLVFVVSTKMNKEKRVKFQTWWENQSSSNLIKNLNLCLDIKEAFLNSSIPICLRRLVHFDDKTRKWVLSLAQKNKKELSHLNQFFTWSIETCAFHQIPFALAHTYNLAWREKLIQGIEICDSYLAKKKEDFKNLQDWIDTSRIHVTEEDLKKNSRDVLPVGTNAVSTKKYIEWMKAEPERRMKTLYDNSRQFWNDYRTDLNLWNKVWNDPLSTEIKLPADLRKSILHAKLLGAFAFFPTSGCYLSEWSFDLSSENDWNMGLYTLIPRFAHEKIHDWRGFVRVSEHGSSSSQFAELKQDHYRQSFLADEKQHFIEVVDSFGAEQGVNQKEEWILQFTNEPSAKMENNSLTILLDKKVYLVSCKEIAANEELFFHYNLLEEGKQPQQKYKMGPKFQETRRSLHLFLPGYPIRKWIEQPKNQELLAHFVRDRLYQYYVDDFSWRTSQNPSSYSHLV